MMSSTETNPCIGERGGSKFLRKARESPHVVAGLGAIATVCALGVYNFRRRGNMKISVFLMQIRIVAQGSFLSCIGIGLGYETYKDHMAKKII